MQDRIDHEIPIEYRKIVGWHWCSRWPYFEPLTIEHMRGFFDDAEIVAYKDGVDWGQIPAAGMQIKATVAPPFRCMVGDLFWAVYEDEHENEHFVQARLLSILSFEEFKSKIVVEVLQIRDGLSFLKPVSESVKRRLTEQRNYCYSPPEGDSLSPYVSMERNWTTISNGSCDSVVEDHCIYTDADGIDHLIIVEVEFSEWYMGHYTFAGDRVLGFHTDIPYR